LRLIILSLMPSFPVPDKILPRLELTDNSLSYNDLDNRYSIFGRFIKFLGHFIKFVLTCYQLSRRCCFQGGGRAEIVYGSCR
jgi:hypothetical protein